MYIDPIYQHNIPFVNDITIMCSSVCHDYILLDYTIMVYCSVSITPSVNIYEARFPQDISIQAVLIFCSVVLQ